jgi:uncharacterized damage-inducible protein DinB
MLQKLFAHDAWANRTVWQFLQSSPFSTSWGRVGDGELKGDGGRALRRLNHIAGAGLLWYDRLHNHPPSVPVWPDWSLDDCGRQLLRLALLWNEYMKNLTPERLATQITYTNSKGEPWTSTVEDILYHVVLHSSYHRGQIASDIRDSGDDPPYTDYIHAIRSGKIK